MNLSQIHPSSSTVLALQLLNRKLQTAVGTAGPQPRVPDLSGPCRTSSASARSQWALPGRNRERQMSVSIAGPQRRAPELSGHCRTSTARAGSQWALRDINCECKMSHRMLDRMSNRMPELECQNRCQIECQNIDLIYAIFTFQIFSEAMSE